MKLSGKNFQPWADFELDIEKLTVLTGPSNKGKSSLFRALMGVLRNELDASYIRDPKKEDLELTLQWGDLKVVATRNKRGKVKYVINDNEYTSLDGMVPPPLRDMACGEIIVGDFKFDPIFATQNSPQFLLDKKAYRPADLNAILGAFGGTERLEAGKREAASRVTEKNGEAKTLAEEIRHAEERKIGLSPLVDAGNNVVAVVNLLEQAVRLQGARSLWLEQAVQRQLRLVPLRELLAVLTLPDLTGAEKLATAASYAQQGADSYLYAKFLKRLAAAQDSVTAPWQEALNSWRLARAAEATSNLLESRREVPDFSQFISQIEEAYAGTIRAYQSIKRIGEIVALRESVEAKQVELTQIASELTQVHEDLKRGTCPKCGRQIEHICEMKGELCL